MLNSTQQRLLLQGQQHQQGCLKDFEHAVHGIRLVGSELKPLLDVHQLAWFWYAHGMGGLTLPNTAQGAGGLQLHPALHLASRTQVLWGLYSSAALPAKV
jgi:hypothetical protein